MWFLLRRLDRILAEVRATNLSMEHLMASVANIQAGLDKLKGDVDTLTGLVTNVLTAVAGGNLSAAQAQAMLDEINATDASVGAMADAINKAVQPATPAA